MWDQMRKKKPQKTKGPGLPDIEGAKAPDGTDALNKIEAALKAEENERKEKEAREAERERERYNTWSSCRCG